MFSYTSASGTLPALGTTMTSTMNSSHGTPTRPITYGCYVSPVYHRPLADNSPSPTMSSTINSPLGVLPSLSRTGSMRSESGTDNDGGRFASPTGYNKPHAINTPIRTVRRMFHHASQAERRAFYDAFLDRPAVQGQHA